MGYGNYRDPFVALRAPQDDKTVIPSEAKESYVVGAGEKEVSLKGLYLCGGEERVNFRILMHHRAGGCISHQLFNGIAGGTSRVTFDGRISVAPDAQQTEA